MSDGDPRIDTRPSVPIDWCKRASWQRLICIQPPRGLVQTTMNTKDIPNDFLRYCIFLNDEECICSERFDRMEIGWYLNHSHDPNVSITPKKRVIAICDIKAEEEIFLVYNELNEPEHLKEAYYEKAQR